MLGISGKTDLMGKQSLIGLTNMKILSTNKIFPSKTKRNNSICEKCEYVGINEPEQEKFCGKSILNMMYVHTKLSDMNEVPFDCPYLTEHMVSQ